MLSQPIDEGVVAGKFPLQKALDGLKLIGYRCVQATKSLRSGHPWLAC
jgi:hypothetical protein